MSHSRKQHILDIRVAAAEMAAERPISGHRANGDEARYASANYVMSFTKGLEHDADTGLIKNSNAFELFRTAIDEGFIDPFTTAVKVSPSKARAWASPTAGILYDIQGPDSQTVTISPAPALGTMELAYEMAEIYELALIRDIPLTEFKLGTTNVFIQRAVTRLNAMNYSLTGTDGRPRKSTDGVITSQTLFRGSSPGVEKGPYLSQFLLLGNDQPGNLGVRHGKIQYGSQQIDQRVKVARVRNYLTKWSDWLKAQDGQDLRDNTTLFDASQGRRFITFPRDLATYVHDDVLYQPYLNACLILLSMGTPFDPGFAKLSGQGDLFLNSLDINAPLECETHIRQAKGFACCGGPHILTLLCEVAGRALKAIFYQKYNTHMRLRPEALAGRIHRAKVIEFEFPCVGAHFSNLATTIAPTLQAVKAVNTAAGSETLLLPLAFQEGSPMHPSYGAGHAAVAGACVTILKAFFDTSSLLVRRGGKDIFSRFQNGDMAIEYTANPYGSDLVEGFGKPFLDLEGELNKLAANTSIGRNMAGIHYYSDYYDSLRMGEMIALGVLEEQALCYPRDPMFLCVPTFDGGVCRIGKR